MRFNLPSVMDEGHGEGSEEVGYPVVGGRAYRQEDDLTTTSSTTPIRPLTAAYKTASSDYQVLKGDDAPQKDMSFVSKLKEYVLGW